MIEMENMEYIDGYFNSQPAEDEKKQFEQRVIQDFSFAEEVAFYISANAEIKEQLRQEKKQRFREIYGQQKVVPITKRPVKSIVRYLAAACIVAALLLLTWFLTREKTSPQQLANQYIEQNFKTLGVTMGSQDSLQRGLRLFNSGKLSEALAIFENLAKNDPSNYNAKKYAGIVYLQLDQYDRALIYFSLLASDTSLYSNPGKFYEALTLIKRNKIGDAALAKKILQEVNAKNLEGKEDAGRWLKKLD